MDAFGGLVVLLLVLAVPSAVTCVLYLLLRGWVRKIALAIVLSLPVALLVLTCIPGAPPPAGEEGKGMIIVAFQTVAVVVFISMMVGLGGGWLSLKVRDALRSAA